MSSSVFRFLPCEREEFNHCCNFDDFKHDGAMEWKDWTKTLKIYAFCWVCLLIIAIIFTAIGDGVTRNYDEWVENTELYSTETTCQVIASGFIDMRESDECVYRTDPAERYDFVVIYRPNCSSYTFENDPNLDPNVTGRELSDYDQQELTMYLLNANSTVNDTQILEKYDLLDYTEDKKGAWECIYNTSDSRPSYENITACWVNDDCTEITTINYFEGEDDGAWLKGAATTLYVFAVLFWIACGGWWLIEFCIYPRHPKDCVVSWVCIPFLCLCSNK